MDQVTSHLSEGKWFRGRNLNKLNWFFIITTVFLLLNTHELFSQDNKDLSEMSLGLSERYWGKRGGLEAQSITNLAYDFSINQFDFFVNAQNIFNQNIQNPDVNAFAIPSVPGGAGRGLTAGVSVKF